MTAAFFELHRGLPREGPGSRADIEWAAGVAGLSPDARILDAGCGPGADIAGLLAHAPRGHVHAVDLHAGFIEEARARWGHDPRVTLAAEDMTAAAGPYDFIWIAGALYFLGITRGLRRMTDRLAPDGRLAFSELVWLSDAPDTELRDALSAEYPAIAGRAVLSGRIAAAGLRVLGQRVLPDASWEAYYTPLAARATALRPGAGADLVAVLDEAEAESALWRRYREQFGYVLSVVAR